MDMKALPQPGEGAARGAIRRSRPGTRRRGLWRQLWQHRLIYLILLPGMAYFLVFRYVPLWYMQVAFRDFRPRLGLMGSPFVGLRHFETFFQSPYFGQILSNTLVISGAKLLLGIPPAIILAIALSEVRARWLGRVVQTVTYLPHFLSWVVMFGVLLSLLSPAEGLVNQAIVALGGQPIAFLTSPATFQPVVVLSDIWKETGWSAIIYLAALLAIDPTLYEAAAVDGASRLRRIWHISLPGMLNVIVLVTLLRLGHILDAGFGQVFVLYSLPVYSVGDIIDTWVYRQGIIEFQFGLAAAVGLFKGVIGLALIVTANRIARRVAGSGLY